MSTSSKPKIRVRDTNDGHPTSYGRHEVTVDGEKYVVSTAYTMDTENLETMVLDMNGSMMGRKEYHQIISIEDRVEAHEKVIERIRSGKLKIKKGMKI